MGAIGGILRATGSNGVNVVRKVKNPELQKLIDQSIADYGSIKSSGEAALSDYITKYLAGAKDSAVRSSQELGTLDQFYNGSMASQLQQLRSSRSKAVMDAADRASQYAVANVNRSRLNSDGGPSSYDLRVLSKNVGDIQTQAAVDNASQERSDLGYLTGNQLALLGERAKVSNAAAGYGLVPEQARQAFYQRNIGNLGGLGQLDQMNKFYGLKQDSNMWADIADSMDQGILNAASIYSSVGGGGMAEGGEVEGPGSGTSDSVNIRASDGEFVVRAAAVKLPGVKRILEVINLLGEDDSPTTASTATSKSGGGMVRVWRGPKGYEMGGPIGVGSFDAFSGAGFSGGSGNTGMLPVDAGSMQSDWMNSPYGASFWNAKSGGGEQQKKAAPAKSSGGGGGLSGQAMALQARVDRDLGMGEFPTTNYGVPEMVPAGDVFAADDEQEPMFWGKS